MSRHRIGCFASKTAVYPQKVQIPSKLTGNTAFPRRDAVSTAVPRGRTVSTSEFLVPSVVQAAFRIHDLFTLSQLERVTR